MQWAFCRQQPGRMPDRAFVGWTPYRSQFAHVGEQGSQRRASTIRARWSARRAADACGRRGCPLATALVIGPVVGLVALIGLVVEVVAEVLDEVLDQIANSGLRDFGYSWGDIASRLVTTRQAAQQSWGTR